MDLTEHERRTIQSAMAGDQQAFDQVVARFARLIYAQSFTILHDRQEAEDVVQESFVKAFRFRVSLQDVDRFPQWLLSIARNLARDRLRRRHPGGGSDGDARDLADERSGSPFQVAATADDLARLEEAIGALPGHYRRALSLRYVDGLDHRSICRQLGVSDGVLRGLLGRGLQRLRACMGTR